MIELLQRAKELAMFLSKYSLGNIKEQSDKLIKDINKYIEESKLYE